MKSNRPWAANLFTKSSGQQSQRDKKREERRRRAMAHGPLSVREQIVTLKASVQDPWREERHERQEETRGVYRSNRQALLKEQRRDEEILRRQLERERQKIDSHYHLTTMKPSHPQYQKTKKRAQERWQERARHMERARHLMWQKKFRELKTNRDRQYRQITKDMKKERHLATGGLPKKLLDPFAD